jgi:hypothetical protein
MHAVRVGQVRAIGGEGNLASWRHIVYKAAFLRGGEIQHGDSGAAWIEADGFDQNDGCIIFSPA